MRFATFAFAIAAVLAFAAVPSASAAVLTVDCNNGPYFAIQPAVTAANPGDVIAVHPCGAYPNGFAVVGKDSIQIVGADGMGAVGAYPVGSGINPLTSPLIYDNGATCVHIENSRNISVVGLALEGCIDNGVRIESSQRINIQGNSLYYAGAEGVAIHGSSDVTIAGNYLSGAQGAAGIRVYGSNRYIEVQNNRVLYNTKHGIHAEGFYVDLINNEISFNGGSGILVENFWSKVSRNTVLGNGSGLFPEVDYNSLIPSTCLVGNQTNFGIQPWLGGGCQDDNN